MKKTILLIGGIILLFSITIISCQKENLNPTQTLGSKAHNTHFRGKLAANPLDSVGVKHN